MVLGRGTEPSVLNGLLSFYPETNLVDGKMLVVFPSNAQLSLRANGIAGTTLRADRRTGKDVQSMRGVVERF